MPVEPPLTATAAQDRLKQVREQIDAALEALVADMVALATAERDTALSEAHAQAAAAIEKVRAESEAALAERVEAVQSQAAEVAKSAAESSLEDRVAAIEAHASKSVAEAEARAAQAVATERAEAERRVAEARAQAAVETAADTRVEERQCDLACLERLLDGIRDLDAAGTLSEVLDKLSDHAATHVPRVAVLIIRGRELRGWRTSGFGEGSDPAAIAVPLDAPTVVGRAVETGALATTANGTTEALQPLAFASLPADRVGLAVPLTVGVRTVAVLYGDEDATGEPTVPSAWPEALEMLARHAASRLELLTMARAYGLHAEPFDSARGQADQRLAQGRSLDSVRGESRADLAQGRQGGAPTDRTATPDAETPSGPAGPPLTPPPGGRPPSLATDQPVETARGDQTRQMSEEDASALRYARLLISEIKLYHEDAVNQGRRDANLLARLGPEIARARRLYEERVPAEVRSRADHFGQELVRTLANGDPKLLGQAT